MSDMGIQQNWKVTIGKDNPIKRYNGYAMFPFLVFDNWYTPEEEKIVWKELDFLSTKPKDEMHRAENTIVARQKDGTSKSKAFRFYIEELYKNRNTSPIIKYTYKQRSPEFHKLIENNCMPFARSFVTSNTDTCFVSYYEEKDHYKPHHDVSLWTCLIWMVREPRLFDGGDFKLNEPDVEVKLKNNRMIMFPSCFLHSVSPVSFHTQPTEIGYGRYCITHFYNSEGKDV